MYKQYLIFGLVFTPEKKALCRGQVAALLDVWVNLKCFHSESVKTRLHQEMAAALAQIEENLSSVLAKSEESLTV